MQYTVAISALGHGSSAGCWLTLNAQPCISMWLALEAKPLLPSSAPNRDLTFLFPPVNSLNSAEKTVPRKDWDTLFMWKKINLRPKSLSFPIFVMCVCVVHAMSQALLSFKIFWYETVFNSLYISILLFQALLLQKSERRLFVMNFAFSFVLPVLLVVSSPHETASWPPQD